MLKLRCHPERRGRTLRRTTEESKDPYVATELHMTSSYKFVMLTEGSHYSVACFYTSAAGAKELSPAFQGWVNVNVNPSPVGTTEIFCLPCPRHSFFSSKRTPSVKTLG